MPLRAKRPNYTLHKKMKRSKLQEDVGLLRYLPLQTGPNRREEAGEREDTMGEGGRGGAEQNSKPACTKAPRWPCDLCQCWAEESTACARRSGSGAVPESGAAVGAGVGASVSYITGASIFHLIVASSIESVWNTGSQQVLMDLSVAWR